jgi:TRAP-type uncharacterized transport system fused permease subunit
MTLAQQRRYELLAFNLLIIGTVASTLFNYYYRKSFWDPHTKHSTHLALVLVLPFFLWQFYGIRQGKRWAKLSYVILTVIGWIFLVLDYKRMAPKLFMPTPVAINTVVQYALTAVVVVLLLLSLRKPSLEPLLATSE